jgi:hypothetical protein
MGCHTWAWRPLSLTRKQKKEYIARYINRLLSITDVEKKYKPMFKKLNRIKKYFLTDSYSNDAVIDKLLISHTNELLKIFDREVYESLDEYHHMFRVGGYPETVLCSEKCTKRYISQLDKVDSYRLKRFWKEYPDGIITFG